MSMIRHGGYAIRKPERINRYASRIRKALIHDIGGAEEDLSMQQVIIIDGVIDMLVIVKMMGEYINKAGVMHGPSLLPCLRTSYLAYRNSISRNLVILGISRKKTEKILTEKDYVESIDWSEDEKLQTNKKAKESA